MAYACKCLRRHDAAARQNSRGCADSGSRSDLILYGRHRGAGLRCLRGTLKSISLAAKFEAPQQIPYDGVLLNKYALLLACEAKIIYGLKWAILQS